MIVLNKNKQYIKIFTNEIEESAKEQLEIFLESGVLKDATLRVMPDVHAGFGVVIGFTAKMKNKGVIIPNIVGVDMGCGVTAYPIDKEVDLKEIDNFIHNNIPNGFKINNNIPDFNILTTKEIQNLKELYSIDINVNKTNFYKNLGSLGGGNHFIEIDEDENKQKYLVVHSGSRKFGYDVANFFQEKAYENSKLYYHNKELSFLPYDLNNDDYLYYYGNLYIKISNFMNNYAYINRKIIINKILKFINLEMLEDKIINSTHNYVETFEDNIYIRKGAISAKKNEIVIIPFNMRDGSIIGVGKGNKDWNLSAPHGAGRIMSRKEAFKKLNVDEFKKSMQNIYTTTVNKHTLDEAPAVYKDYKEILKNIENSVEVIHKLKPIYNFKANN